MSTIKIHVTKDDIRTTNQGDPQGCMVWKSVTRSLQLDTGADDIEVDVYPDSITLTGPKGEIRVQNIDRVEKKINRYDGTDNQNRIRPFEFDLDLPDDWREQITTGVTKS